MSDVRPFSKADQLGRPKPVREVTAAQEARNEAAARERFKQFADSLPCIGEGIPGHVCEFPMQAMHVVPKAALKRRGLKHLFWEIENAVNGCYPLHRRHDNWAEKIDRDLLPLRCVEWAARHGLTEVLDRHWPFSEESEAA